MSDRAEALADQVGELRQKVASLTAQAEEIESLLDADTSAPPRLKSGTVERIRMHLSATNRTRDALIERAEKTEAKVASLTEQTGLMIESNSQRVAELLADKRALTEERDRLKAAIAWALGEEGEFGEEPPPVPGKPRRRYWWRDELRRRSLKGD